MGVALFEPFLMKTQYDPKLSLVITNSSQQIITAIHAVGYFAKYKYKEKIHI